ncbi:MAG: protein kinase [Gemmatimonadetes bacterium]|nr:protein kinase [Gemmatimonadota bacterium]
MDLADRLREAVADRYAVERELGRGGMAVVYLARDLRHQRRVAIKVLRPELTVTLVADRFLREIQIAAQLQHPLIVPLHDSGGTDELLWYVMPCIEGETLRERLRREKQLPLEDALRVTRDAAAALQCAHQHGFVHRDIKPENILLSGGHALLADFGIARALTRAVGEGTSSGVAIGTPAYMSPEQAAGGTVIDARSDVYSLGCVVYEMLAGEPPFTGPTPQAVIARHLSEHVPSLTVVRTGLSGAVQGVVERALAKVPADRFGAAQAFCLALEEAVVSEPGSAPRRRWRPKRKALLGGAAVLLFGALVWRAVVFPPRSLDPARVIVYPLASRSESERAARFGEDVATAVFTALNFTEYLKAADGWRLLDASQREDPRWLTERDVRRVSARAQAGFAVDGSILVSDSARGVIRLHDVAGDSSIQIPVSLAANADAWTVGLHAAIALLPRLIPAGQPVDLHSLSERSPAAVAWFLRGEQAYRRARFREALEYYRGAVTADPAFALAALRGAQAASWNLRDADALELIRTALAHQALLFPRDRDVARGFEAYLLGRAEPAVRYFQQALALDRRRPEVWMALGEVYTHLLPDAGQLDSLAETAFKEARQLDSTFAPVLYHLIEIALRQGDVVEATRLMRQFRETGPDSAERVPLEIMLTCVRESPDKVDWRGLARSVPQRVVEAGRSLAVAGLYQPRCAEAAWRAILAHDTATGMDGQARRWGALSGLQALLVAEGRTDALTELLRQDREFGPDRIARLYILSALAGAPVEDQADQGAAELRRVYEADLRGTRSATSVPLWYLGLWEAHRGRSAEAGVIADSLAAWAARRSARREALMAKSVAARALLAGGDSTTALKPLLALVPDTVRGGLQWSPWESLGGERLLLARLRFARGEFAEGYRVAAGFDGPPVPHVMYLAASLVLRMSAAERLADRRAADAMQRRLLALGRQDLVKGQ